MPLPRQAETMDDDDDEVEDNEDGKENDEDDNGAAAANNSVIATTAAIASEGIIEEVSHLKCLQSPVADDINCSDDEIEIEFTKKVSVTKQHPPAATTATTFTTMATTTTAFTTATTAPTTASNNGHEVDEVDALISAFTGGANASVGAGVGDACGEGSDVSAGLPGEAADSFIPRGKSMMTR